MREYNKLYYGKETITMNGKLLSIIGLMASLIGTGATILGDWAAEKKMDTVIDEKIAKALSEKKETEKSE